MRHRHLIDHCDPNSVWAVEDVLERGHLEDWRDLAQRIVRDPDGPAARSLRVVLGYFEGYGTSRLWQDFLERVETGRYDVSQMSLRLPDRG